MLCSSLQHLLDVLVLRNRFHLSFPLRRRLLLLLPEIQGEAGIKQESCGHKTRTMSSRTPNGSAALREEARVSISSIVLVKTMTVIYTITVTSFKDGRVQHIECRSQLNRQLVEVSLEILFSM